MWRSWLWVSKNDIDRAEWFLKVDSDTFLFPEHVRDYVLHKHWAYRDKHYFGRAPGPAALYV